MKPKQCIGTLRLFGMIFTCCVGGYNTFEFEVTLVGAYGIEDAVGAVGPLLAIIFMLLMPWFIQVFERN